MTPAFSAAATIRRHAASSGGIGLFQQDVIAKRGERFGRLDVCADGDRVGEPAAAGQLSPAGGGVLGRDGVLSGVRCRSLSAPGAQSGAGRPGQVCQPGRKSVSARIRLVGQLEQ